MSVFDVGFEVGGLRKRLGADVALERPKATVGVRVPLQLGWGDEGLATFLALVAQPTVHAATAAVSAAAAQGCSKAAAAAATTQVTIATSEDLVKGGHVRLSNRIEVVTDTAFINITTYPNLSKCSLHSNNSIGNCKE